MTAEKTSMPLYPIIRGSRRLQQPNPMRYDTPVMPNDGGTTANIMDASAELDKVAQALIVNDAGMVLGVSRGKGSDEFTPPGGTVEPGEESVDAAARELEEETGLSAETLMPLFSRVSDDRLVSVFLCKANGKIRSSDEGDVRWIAPQRLMDGRFGDYYTDMFASIGFDVG